jgi:tetratricopeptide (TPR) repeat protein
MAVLPLRSPLSTEERHLRQRLILRDTISLAGLFAITIVLFFITLFLFHSFSVHREELAKRWVARGEAAMHAGHPQIAVDALRSAQAYAPGDDQLQIELAEALAAAGRVPEATAYFNALLDSKPGDGRIHLQLARLAARQQDFALAQQHYQAALDGTWEGDGYVRRREVRLELARYLISQKHYDQARTHLLIAAGNAPDDAGIEIDISKLLESAQDEANALHFYKKALLHRPVQLEAVEGAGRSAYALGRFLQAKQFLERALNHPDFEKNPAAEQEQYRGMLADSDHILLLYPGVDLNVRSRAERILNNKDIAQKRLADCLNDKTVAPPALQSLAAQWQQLPSRLKSMQLERDPELEQAIMNLVYKTEQVTSQYCEAPTGDDALLLKIAAAPEAVEQL